MFNMPKCKNCIYYETSCGCHACDSPKWRWTEDDKKEYYGHLDFAIKHSFPKFILSRHCAYKEIINKN